MVGESLVRHFLYLVLYTFKSHLAYPDIITNHGREKQNESGRKKKKKKGTESIIMYME